MHNVFDIFVIVIYQVNGNMLLVKGGDDVYD